MLDNYIADNKVIESCEQLLNKTIQKLKDRELTYEILSKFFDYVINNLKEANLINDNIFDLYQGKLQVKKKSPENYKLFFNYDIPVWQKFYNFNRHRTIDDSLKFIKKNLKKASLKDKLYYSFSNLFKQLELDDLSDYYYKKLKLNIN